MTAAELGERMSSREFSAWAAFHGYGIAPAVPGGSAPAPEVDGLAMFDTFYGLRKGTDGA
jgi:hypothetical protein